MNYKLLLLLLIVADGFSQNAILDNSFGVNGKVTTSLPNSFIEINSLEIQTDGKIITCGYEKFETGFVLIRYNVDGSIDSSFGDQGKVINSDFFRVRFSKLKLQSDGKIIVSGQLRTNEFSNGDTFVTRYNTTGAVDTTFGTNGYYIITTINEPSNLCIHSDDKILVCSYDQRKIFKLTNSGELDNDFGINGIVDLNSIGANEFITEIKIQNDGKIVLSGGTDLASAIEQWNGFLIRLDSNGTADSTFGINGNVITDFNNKDIYESFDIDDDNNIVAVGYSYLSNTSKIILAKYTSNGILDSNFGTNGKVITQTSSINMFDIASDIKLQSDGKILCVGQSGRGYNFNGGTSQPSDMLLLRYNTDGSLDTTFSPTGYVTTSFDNNIYNSGSALAMQNDGNILVGGSTINLTTGGSFALARYTFDNLAATSFTKIKSLSLVPNPANDFINFGKEIVSVQVYTIDGKNIDFDFINNSIDVSRLSKGIYLVIGKNEDGDVFENKLIKN
jgi:uncharacterized delta-60 repeat protein